MGLVNRAVIVSSDGHIIDGHHRAMAAAQDGEPVKAVVLDAPVVQAVRNAPSARSAYGQATDDKVSRDEGEGSGVPAETDKGIALFSHTPDTKAAYEARIDWRGIR